MPREELFAWIPKLLAILALGPLLLGLGWLLQYTISQSLEREQKWVAGTVRGLEDLGEGTWRVAVEFNGKQVEAEVSSQEALSGVQLGEALEVAINPNNPGQFQRPGAVENWAVPAMVSFFFLVILGLFIFMLRIKTPPMPNWDEFEEGIERTLPGQDNVQPPKEILVKSPPHAYKLSGIAGTLLFMAAALVTPQIPPDDLDGRTYSSLLLLCGSIWCFWKSAKVQSIELLFKDDTLRLSSIGSKLSIPLQELSSLQEVHKAGRPERETDYWCLDQHGKVRLKIEHVLQPEDQLRELTRILKKRLPLIKP